MSTIDPKMKIFPMWRKLSVPDCEPFSAPAPAIDIIAPKINNEIIMKTRIDNRITAFPAMAILPSEVSALG